MKLTGPQATVFASVIAVFGLILGAFLTPLASKLISPPETAPRLPTQLCDQYGIKIVTPQNHADVPVEFELTGTYEKAPPEGYVLVYLTPPNHSSFWPNSIVDFDPLTRTWKAQARLLGDPTPQIIEGDYMVVLVGKSGRLYWDYYWRVSQETGHWIYFDGLTEDTILCAQVSVKRTK